MIHRKVGNHLAGCINGVTVHVITYFRCLETLSPRTAHLQLPLLFTLADFQVLFHIKHGLCA